MKHFCSFLLLAVITFLSALVIFNKIEIGVFTGISIVWFFTYLFVAGGVESIKEFTAGKLSIKRSVKEAQQASLESQKIRDELSQITKVNAENAYILASTSMLAAGDSKAREKLEENLEVLSKFVEPDKVSAEKWWNDLGDLFPERKSKK